MDINKEIIDNLNKGIISFYEPNLQDLFEDNKNIRFTTDLKYLIDNTDCCIITIGTPQSDDGECDVSNIISLFNEFSELVSKEYSIIIKSTVPVGFADYLKNKFNNNNWNIISNPEFLAEGCAVDNFLNQDRTIIGADNKDSFNLIKEIYKNINTTFICMDNVSAELVKLASNSFLALKISFINEIANISSKYNGDINKISQGIGADKRIGDKFLKAGCGYGGSCFEKDIENLIYCSNMKNYNPILLEQINPFNIKQEKKVIEHLLKRYNNNLKNRTISIWGLSFKPETSDIRCSPALTIIDELLKEGCNLNVHDPLALDNVKNWYDGVKGINYFDDKYECLVDCDDLLILTEWEEYVSADKNLITVDTVYDLRGIYSEMDKNHYRIGVNL